MSRSLGIQAWAGEQSIELEWESGTGDARVRGWLRADGERAIETNGDPVFPHDDGFEELWESRGMTRARNGAAREMAQAERTAGWMRMNMDLYRMVLRTSLGLEQGTLSEREHMTAKRRARLALAEYNRGQCEYAPDGHGRCALSYGHHGEHARHP